MNFQYVSKNLPPIQKVSFLLQEKGQKEIYQQKYKDKTKKYRIVITKNNREGKTKLNRNNSKGRNLPN